MMRFRRRTPSRSSTFDTLMDSVMGELFPRNSRAKRPRMGGSRQRSRTKRQDFALELMEPRLLLSADLSFSTSTHHDVTVRLDGSAVQIVDTAAPNPVLASAPIGTTAAVRITGSDSADNITVDLTAAFDAPVFFTDATADADSLSVVGQGLHWTLTGADAGHADGAAGIFFSGVEKLVGDATKPDEFSFETGASSSDGVDGGAGAGDAVRFGSNAAVTLTDTLLGSTQTIANIDRAFIEAPSVTATSFSGQVFLSTGVADWVEQGPQPYASGLKTPLLWDPVAGAIQAVAIDPTDRFTTYVGTTNGGVWRNTGGTEVLFGLNSATLDLAATNTLNAFADFLEAHPTLAVEIGGHTDSSGPSAANQQLSLDRANNVRDHLVNTLHIDPSRLTVVAFGETRPVQQNDNLGHSAANRRVELQIQNWQPMTDDMPSLSIGSLAISPLDHQTIYAGLARTASFKSLGGPLNGLLFSSDRGEHWKPLASTELAGLVVTKVLPTTITAGAAQVVFVSTFDVDRDGNGALDDAGGVFRLEVLADGTLQSFQKISGAGGQAGLQAGPYTDLAMDDSGAQTIIYAANINQGLFRFTEGAASWVGIGNNDHGFVMGDSDADTNDDLLQGSTRIKFAIGPNGGTLYAGVIGPVNTNGIFDITANRRGLVSLFKTTDHGDNWTNIAVPTSTDGAAPGVVTGLHPGRQGDTHFAIVVDPTNSDIFYVAGDRQPTTTNNSVGLQDFAARIFRFDPTLNGGTGGYEQIVGNNASDALHITAPHADARGLAFLTPYQLLNISDGGLYMLENPRGEPAVSDTVSQGDRRWTSQNRDLRSTEVLQLAFDRLNGQIMVGAQDDGSTYQAGNADGLDNDNDGNTDEADERFFWTGDTAGDGNAQVAIPFDSDAIPGDDRVLRYSLFNNFNFLDVYEFDANATQLDANPADATTMSLRIGLRSVVGAARLSGIDPLDRSLGFDRIPMVVNRFDSTRMLIGYNGLYESAGAVSLAPGANRLLPLEVVSTIDPAVAGRPVRDLIYGGITGGNQNNDLVIAARANQVLFRQAMGNAFAARTVTGAGNIQAIAVDPDNWHVVYATDGTHVFRTSDVTVNAPVWTRIDGNLSQIGQTGHLSLAYVQDTGGDMLLLGGTDGVTRLFNPGTATDASAVWSRLGSGLPSALVSDIEYLDLDGSKTLSAADVLIAGTMGRGAWSITGDALAALGEPSKLQVFGAITADTLSMSIDPNNPLRFSIDDAVDGTVFSARFDNFDKIEFLLRDGDDTLTIDHSLGAIAVPGGITVDGGDDPDTLVLTGGDTPASASGATFREITDVSGKREHVDFLNVTTIDDGTLPDPLDNPFDTVRSSLQSLFDLLTFDDGLSQDLPFFGTSFARALNNVPLNTDLPISTPGVPVASQAEQVVETSTDTQDFLRRFFTAGHGAITLADLSSFTTLQQLADAIQGLDEDASDGGTVSFTGDLTSGFELTLSNIRKTMHGRADVDLDLDLPLGRIDVKGTIDVGARVTLNMVLGVDNTNGFYIRSNPAHDIVVDHIQVQNLDDVKASGRFGFLGVDLTNATLAMAPGVHFDIDITNAGDSFVQVSDLLGNLAGYTAVDLKGEGTSSKDVTLTGTFGVSAFLPGSTAPFTLLDARADIAWDDIEASLLNSSGNVTVAPTPNSAGGALMRFLQLDAPKLVSELTELRDGLDDALGQKVPFLSDGLTTIIDFANKFQQQVIEPITGGIGGAAAIPSVQDLAKRIAASLGIEPQALGLAYDAASTELTYHLQLQQSIDKTSFALGTGVDLADGLAELKFSTSGDVDATLSLDVVFGVDMDQLVTTPAEPEKWFFIRNPSATATLNIDADDVEATARFGFVEIGVDEGTLGGTISFTVSLKDPKTQADDGRIDLGELLDGIDDPASLVTLGLGGSLDLMLPVEAPFLGIPAVTTPPNPANVITVSIPDLGDLDSAQITLGSGLTELGNFGNIDAASLVSLIGQVTNWLDDFRNGEQFKNFDIPLVGTALDQVLGFADAFRDKLLFDDGDDGVDGANALITDLNEALASAKLSDRLRAEADGTKIRLVANDASITTFKITNPTAGLGFSNNQSSSGAPFQSLTADSAPSPDSPPSPDSAFVFLTDQTFDVAIGNAPAVTVTLRSSVTANNTKLGNDKSKLVDANNTATFTTADEMVLKLVEALNVPQNPSPLVYNPTDDTLTFNLNLSEVFGQVDLPIDFQLPNLPQILEIGTSGLIRLMANGSLMLTLGVYLGDAPASSKLDGTEALNTLNGGIDISSDLHIDGTGDIRTIFGQLSGDATLNLSFDSAAATAVTVKQADTTANTTIAHLVQDLNDALTAKSLNTKVVAVADGLRIKLQKAAGATWTTLKLTASADNAAVKDLGFSVSQDAALSARKIVAVSDLNAPLGRLTSDAHFTLNVSGANHAITLAKADTLGNTSAQDLVVDLNTALAAAGIASQVSASLDGARLRLQEVTPGSLTSLSLTAASTDAAVTQLGFGTSQSAAAGIFEIAAKKDLQAIRGRLTGNASFDLALNTLNGGTPFTITLLAADDLATPAVVETNTATNRYAFDLVSDIEAELAKVAGMVGQFDIDGDGDTETANRIQVSYSAGALHFWTVDGATSFTLSNANAIAMSEMGLPGGTTQGNSIDLEITTRGIAQPFGITLDGAVTLSDVMQKIEAQTTVGGVVKVEVDINDAGTGLKLTDTTTPSSPTPGTFAVKLRNNAVAGIKLGIVRMDAQQGEQPDGVIEGGDIAGLRPLDRFFIQNVNASVGLHLSTPTLDPQTGQVIDGDADGQLGEDGLKGTIKLGFLGLEAKGGGKLDATLAMGLKDPDGDNADADGSRISLAELIGALDDLDTIVQAPTLTGGGSILLDLTVTPPLTGLTLPPNTQLGIVVNDLGDPFSGQAPDIQFVFPDALGDFEAPEFNLANIIAALRSLATFLEGFEEFGFLQDPLPVVNVSVHDLIDIAGRFSDAIDQAQANPAGTVQFLESKLKEAFGLPQNSTALDLEIVKDDNGTSGDSDDFSMLKISSHLSASFSEKLGVAFDLGLPDPLPGGFGGSADLLASGGIDLNLDFGIRVDNPPENVDDPLQIYVYDTTGLEGTLKIGGEHLSFHAAVGPLGIFVNEGSAVLKGNLGPDLSKNKIFDLGLDNPNWTNGRQLLGDIDFDTDLTAELGGAVTVALPMNFPIDSKFAGTVKFDGTLSLDPDNGLQVGGAGLSALGPDGQPTTIGAMFTDALNPANLNLLDQLLLGVDGVDLFLEGLQDVLDGEVAGVKLPLIGDKLAGAVDDIAAFRAGFIADFRKAVEDLANPTAAFNEAAGAAGLSAASAEPDPISKILGDLLGDDGLGLLRDVNDDGFKDAADIRYQTNLNEPGLDPADLFFDWDFELGDDYDASAGIAFDIGIPGLGLETEGKVEATVGWTLGFGFGLNTKDGFYLDVGLDGDAETTEDGKSHFDAASELRFDVDVGIPGGSITGKLGFLQLTAKDDSTDGDGLLTHLGATFAVDIFNKSNKSDTKLGFNELGKIGLDVGIAAEAVVDLDMRLALNSDLVPGAATNFPSLVADFTLDWGVGDRATVDIIPLGDLDGSFLKNGLKSVYFEKVGLDLGTYFSNLIGPIVETVQEVTEPIKPFLDFLTEPIPVISQLAGPTSLLDIAAMSGVVNPGIIKAIQIVDQVVDIAHSLDLGGGGNLVLYFDEFLPEFGDGSHRLVIYQAPPSGFAAAAAGSLPDLSNPNLDLGALKDELLAGLDWLPEELQDALGDVADSVQNGVKKMLPGGGADFGFKLPIIDDPTQVFGMLLGQPADLVEFSMDALELKASFSAFFSLLGPLGVSINADFAAQFGPFRFAYDTLGITEFASSGFKNPLLLFDGFYIDDLDFAKTVDDSGKQDVPELQFDAGLWAAAELNLAVARGGVGGGLFAEIDFDLHDPDDDGRVRIKELIANVVNQAKYFDPVTAPLAAFDITGKLTAELFAFVKVDLFLLQIDERWHITDPITLLDFESNFTRVPTLATELGDGVLQLNMGKFAEQRVEGDLSDGDEHFIVKQGDDPGEVKVWSSLVDFDGEGDYDASEAQTYSATKLILALGGAGNDTIDLSGVTDDIDFELEGNDGDDIISAGSGKGKARILGGAGKDTLTGGGGADTIFGETGDDIIDGMGGRDWIFGDGKFKDAIQDHPDVIAHPGQKVITIEVKSNDGVDTIDGGDDEDLIIGAGGGDTIHGDGGNDVILGEGGQVTVDGTTRLVLTVVDTSKGKGFVDKLWGDAGQDRIWAGLGDDEIHGGTGGDEIWGEGGADTIDGGDEDPNELNGVTPGTADAKDPIKTNSGDRIHGGSENDTIHGNAGKDHIFGDEGSDQLFGDADDDRLFGGTGTDVLEGNAGNDELFGNSDPDKLFGGIGNDILEGGHGNDFLRGGAGLDLLIAGYGSDDLDGEGGSDSYRITARGGSITELTIAYDSGVAGTDILTLVGTDQKDTVLLRAMADYYFPDIVKLVGSDEPGKESKGITDRILVSGEPDKLGAILQALTDAYGPHDMPNGLLAALIQRYQDEVQDGPNGVLQAIDTANNAVPPAQKKLTQEQLDGLHTEVVKIFDSNTSFFKLEEIRGKIRSAYEAAEAPLPGTILDKVKNAYDKVAEQPKQPQPFHAAFEKIIADAYVDEGLVGLLALVDRLFDADAAADSKQAIIDAVDAAYKGTPAALQTALTNAQATAAALKSAIKGAYDKTIDVPGIETDTGFVALINDGGKHVERFNYRQMEGLVVNTLGGDDYVVSDDVIAATTVNLGIGEDRMQVGQVFRSERVKNPIDPDTGEEILITNITAEDVYTTLAITRGWLSNGISRPMTVNGGDNNDQMTVFHNVDVLNLNGGDGDDIFTVRAFALKGSTDSERARTDMKGDGGADTILYVVNAPVGIDGGDGFDTVRIVGTEFADDFVVTDAGIFGAGLNVSYVNIEKVVADGAEGDDRFFVLSTGVEVVTEIDGGLGSDTFFVGGNPSRAPIPVISNDFRGHSGIILHNVESTDDPAWAGVPVEGISANVGDDEDDFVLVREFGGSTRVLEDATSGGEGWQFDYYGIRLTHAPGIGQVARINVALAGIAPEDEAKLFKDLEFFSPVADQQEGDYSDLNNLTHALGFDSNTGAALGPILVFNSNNWNQLQYVKFRAAHDDASEGRRFVFVNHTLQNSTDPDYQGAHMLSVKVQMEDDDRAGLIVTPTGRDNVVLEGSEGFQDTFTVRLARAPTDTVTLKMGTANAQITLAAVSGSGLTDNGDGTWSWTFSANDADANAWNKAKEIRITANDDSVVEGFHTDYIRFTLDSVDDDGENKDNPDPEKLNGDPELQGIGGVGDGFINVDGDFDKLGIQAIPDAKPTSYVLLQHRPLLNQPITIKVGSETLAANRYKISGNTLTFLGEDGVTSDFRVGQVYAKYKYLEPGYDGAFVKDISVDIYDDDTPMVIVRQSDDDGMVDVIEGSGIEDTYTVQLSQAPGDADDDGIQDTIKVNLDAKKTRTTYGRTALFEVQVEVTDKDADGDGDTNTLSFTSANWNKPLTVYVQAKQDTVFDGNDTQVFAPDLQTVNKIRGPLIIEGAAGLGSLSLPKALMLPHELNFLKPDGDTVVAFTPGSGPGATETMTVMLKDLNKAFGRLQDEDHNIEKLQDLVGKTLELSQGPGTDVMLDPTRPEDLFNRFWLIEKIDVKVVGDPDDKVNGQTDDQVELTLRNPSTVDPDQLDPEAAVPTEDTSWAVTSLSVNFFADEREQVDYMFVFDDDSVANDKGALTSSDGAVQSFIESNGSPDTLDTMVVETGALQAVAKLDDIKELNLLKERRLEITVGPGLDRAWTIKEILPGPNNDATFKTLKLEEIPTGVADAPTDRSEFRIAGGDTHGRITGFGMGPNLLFAGRPQGGGITYGDLEVVQVSLGRGKDEVRVDYTTNAEDHTTKRDGDFYTLTMLDTGLGDDVVTVNLQDGDDGAFSLNLNVGDDKAFGSDSSLPLVVFGWDGKDEIHGGAGDDILFGDRGRIDYVQKVNTDTNNDGEPDKLIDTIVTRLGHSATQNPVNPPVTSADSMTITDLRTTFETAFGGLVGLSVQAISPEGHVQFRTIVANTAHTITIDRPWDSTPVGTDSIPNLPPDPLPDPLPNTIYFYRVSAYPEDQTDGQFRQATLIRTIEDGIGGNDTLDAGGGDDIVIGGAGNDMVDGGLSRDLIFGDNVSLERTNPPGNYANPRFRALGGTQIYDTSTNTNAGGALVTNVSQLDPHASTFWGDLKISLNDSNFGNDYIAGGGGDDEIFGQLGNDVIQGDGSIDILPAVQLPAGLTANWLDNTSTVASGVVGANNVDFRNLVGAGRDNLNNLYVNHSDDGGADGDDYIEGGPGVDTVFGNLGQDDIVGGSSDLFSLGGAANKDRRADGSDLLFGGSAGSDIARLNAGDDTSTNGHASDADTIVGDNGDIFRLVGVNGNQIAPANGSSTLALGLIKTSNGFLAFNYDDYDPSQKIVVRAVQLNRTLLLDDYTPGGPDFNAAAAAGDIGAADEIHGGKGDDFIYGGKGNDVLFGDGQNDSIIGGYDADWISGGNGDDGILGDDGRIFASRNSTSFGEPLYGIARIPDNQITLLIVEKTGKESAMLNVAGQLKYTADLTPDNLDPAAVDPQLGPNTNFRPRYANDIIYGGLGNDSIHSGAGDDAILGGEALDGGEAPDSIKAYLTNYDQKGNLVPVNNNTPSTPFVTESDFAHPFNPGNPLGFKSTVTNPTQLSKDMGKFALYDATSDPHRFSDPLRKIMLNMDGTLSKDGPEPSEDNRTWFLDFKTSDGLLDTFWVPPTGVRVLTDGDDRIFGDLGNDWVVGGTGRDAMFPGWGNDLVNADDDLETHGGLNDRTDTNPSYNDLVYGGAGLDVLIANTGGDRMDDFVGEFNSFYTPYSNFGLPTVQRLPNPGLTDFLLQVAKSDGADLSLAAQYSAAATRNGEPFGELGMVLHQDAAWQSNLGNPRDSQAGNLQNNSDTTDNGLPIQQVAAAAAPYSTAVATITQDELDSIVAAAKQLWITALGAGDPRLAVLDEVTVLAGNLPSGMLGETTGAQIVIDRSAQGWGWFVDPTPNDNSEFAIRLSREALAASPSSPAAGRMDLLTTVVHELGNAMGFPEDHGHDVMGMVLQAGERRVPTELRLPTASERAPAAVSTLATTSTVLAGGIHADTLRVHGLEGTDTFNVTTSGNGRSHNGDGALPSGKKKSIDNLNMLYTPPRPTIIHSPATKDPVAGVVDLDYGTARFVVQYD
jgi:outer membrane protein OmpA-like peptidoglycan-associated protein/Ca2+-binding RTX toxin-like protein